MSSFNKSPSRSKLVRDVCRTAYPSRVASSDRFPVAALLRPTVLEIVVNNSPMVIGVSGRGHQKCVRGAFVEARDSLRAILMRVGIESNGK